MSIKNLGLLRITKDDQDKQALLDALKEAVQSNPKETLDLILNARRLFDNASLSVQTFGSSSAKVVSMACILGIIGDCVIREAMFEWIESGEVKTPEGW
jgi:hypothetical protein